MINIDALAVNSLINGDIKAPTVPIELTHPNVKLKTLDGNS